MRSGLRFGCAFAAVAVLATGAPFIAAARPIILEDIAKITPPGPDDQLIAGIGVSGDHLIFNTRRNFQSGNEFVSEQFAYLYTRNDAGVWTHTDTLISLGHPHQAELRVATGIHGDIAAVNVSTPSGGQLGVYERMGAQWVRTATLASTFTGRDLEIDGGHILVSGPRCSWNAFRKEAGVWRAFASAGATAACVGEDVDVSGEIIAAANPLYPTGSVFMYHGFGSQHHAAIVTDPLRGQPGQFGSPVAMGGVTMFAGRLTRAFEGGVPRVFAFERNTEGVWRRVADFGEPDAAQLADMTAMDAQHGRIAVGYPSDSSRVTGGGTVVVYQRGSTGVYSSGARLFPGDVFETGHLNRHQFGVYVDVDGRTVAASALQAVYVFQLPTTLRDAELMQDDFQDGDSAGWTPSQSTWGVATVDGSRVYQQRDVNGVNVRSILSSVARVNQAVEVQARPTAFSGADRWFGVIARYTDPSNYYYLSVRSSNRVILRRRQDGIFTDLDEASLPVTPNKTYRLRLEAIGARIRGYVDGVLLVEAVDRELSEGNPGLITYGAQVNFDNVVITPSPLLTLFADNFEGQFVHTAWRVVSGEWEHVVDFSRPSTEQRSHYAQIATSGRGRVVGGVPTVDQVIEIETSAPAALRADAWYGAMARYRNDGNFYYLRIGGDNRISLRKQLNGAVSELDGAPFVHQPGVRYRLRLEALGPVLRGYVNGRLLLEARDSSHRTGAYGLGAFATAADFHEVLVTQP